DLVLVGAREPSVAHDFLAADVEPVDSVRAGEHEPCDWIVGPAELERVRRPDGEVGALPGHELSDVVASEHGGAAGRAESKRIACGQRLRAAAHTRDE